MCTPPPPPALNDLPPPLITNELDELLNKGKFNPARCKFCELLYPWSLNVIFLIIYPPNVIKNGSYKNALLKTKAMSYLNKVRHKLWMSYSWCLVSSVYDYSE